MKKLICLLLLLAMTLPLASCGLMGAANAPTINGVKITEYSIVYDAEGLDYNKRAAEYIRDTIKQRSRVTLPIIDDGEAQGDYEIVVGETSRPISAELNEDTEGLEFSMLAKGGSVALEGDYFIIAAAAFYFMETYVLESGYAATIEDGTLVRAPILKEAKNFILLIGDGMGVYQTQMFEHIENNVEYGDGEDIFYGYLLPYMGYSRTDSLTGTTDSAAGGTALSCGTKTYNKRIARDKDGKNLESMTELAHRLGKAAGVMSTETKTGATPSTFSAHADDRDDNAIIIGSQAEAMLSRGLVIDCGYNYYTSKYMEVIERHITDTLGKVSGDEDGFFLMYEEAYIDKHFDDMNMEKSFEAMVRFNQAIARFMEFAFYNPDTFILITADHETGGLHLDENGNLAFETTEHTSANVPIFAYGVDAELFDGKEVENIQIAHTIAALMGEENFGDQSVYGSLTK